MLKTELAKSLLTTDDGSPTFRFGDGEKMHSSAGALTETLYIYGEAVKTALEIGAPPRFLSVGLGLGYVELTCAVECLRAGIPANLIEIESRETVPELTEIFAEWIGGHEGPSAGFAEAHAVMARMFEEKTGVAFADVLALLRGLRESGGFRILGGLGPGGLEERKNRFGAILYDPFSGKTSPHLWEEGFLTSLLAAASETPAVFTTYAARGALNRALRNTGFELRNKPGFWKKRESTFAVKTS